MREVAKWGKQNWWGFLRISHHLPTKVATGDMKILSIGETLQQSNNVYPHSTIIHGYVLCYVAKIFMLRYEF